MNKLNYKKMELKECCESYNSFSSSSSASSCLSSSLDMADDASSSNFSPPSNGPLYELDDLMAQLPIFKRGLSKFYSGKSQTFGSLWNVKVVEDLAKKGVMSCSTRIKSCKTRGFEPKFNFHQQKFGPNPTISKRSSKISSSPFVGTKP